MKKVFKIISVIILGLLLLIVAVLAHAGLFESVIAVEQETGPYTIVYKEHIGAYHKVKPAMDEVYQGLLDMGIETYRGAGVYYDNPQHVPEEQLRSEVGSVLEDKDLDKVDQIKQVFKVREVPQQQSIVVEFPIRNMLSYMIAPAKVYKEADKIWQEQGYSDYEYAVEIYDVPNKVSTYILPLDQVMVDKIIMEEPIMMPLVETEEATAEADDASSEAEVIDESTPGAELRHD